MSIYPETRERTNIISGCRVGNSIRVHVRDVARVNDLVTVALNAGANELNGVKFTTTRNREYHDEARRLALKAAREKAADMATQLDMRLGPPQTIVEMSDGAVDFRASANISLSTPSPSTDRMHGVIVPGAIHITALVQVSFELVPVK